ncbi:hypothetical protein KVR01_008278 [Diaporthe batatas]|uniref:uncharacterized protein n=1 Tax=Diaporthe batatas TaxID=748121 RepID=UPI001D037941|nr:uncharacterized protein KVR01_008278 [Diaporthe batatas]KAG8162513.1 hypothetical protein KVR01_008278 [Diaporthe batatas]
MAPESYLPRRIVVCVDGTWFDEDGREGNYSSTTWDRGPDQRRLLTVGCKGCGRGNNSNVFRLWASVKEGLVTDANGNNFDQKYFQGIGVGVKRSSEKLNAGIYGTGCGDKICEVYQYCCTQVKSPDDELWLFGFSRVAYIVQAVASLMQYGVTKEHENRWQSSSSGSERPRSIIEAIGLAKRKQSFAKYFHGGKEYRVKSEMNEAPVIKFLGLFDTVQMSLDTGDVDVSQTRSIKAIRHALALNEERRPLSPSLYDCTDTNSDNETSIVQAWFVGTHGDIGGGTEYDGLSLYPLQWMLLESKLYGLVLEHNSDGRLKGLIEDPLKLVFPPTPFSFRDPDTERASGSDQPVPWIFKYSNGLEISMQDMRPSHNHGNLQTVIRHKLQKRNKRRKGEESNKETAHRPRHFVRLNTDLWGKVANHIGLGKREVFQNDSKELKGYSKSARNCTVIHPSTYFLLETCSSLGIGKALAHLKPQLEKFRDETMEYGGNGHPWLRDYLQVKTPTLSTFRILICGNAGVGKSTLLNRVFGTDMTTESHNELGRHNIEEAFESDQHPGLLVHDSEGFQTGTDRELLAFKKFLKRRSSASDPEEQLHAIWICLESHNSRPVQHAMVVLLRAISEEAPSLPIVVVGTKADILLKINDHSTQIREQKKREFQHAFETNAETALFWDKLKTDFTFVSYNDPESTLKLIQMTMTSVIDPVISETMCAVQIQDVDAKIDQAIEKTIRLLRIAVTNVSAGWEVVIAGLIGTPTISRVLCNHIVFGCYGLPASYSLEAEAILSRIVWSNLVRYMGHAWVNICVFPLGTTLMLEAPAAARMVLKCACDLVIILDKGFRDHGGAPTMESLRRISRHYARNKVQVANRDGSLTCKSRRGLVHAEVNEIFPIHSGLALTVKVHTTKRISAIRDGCREIIYRHGFQKEKDLAASLSTLSLSSSSEAVTDDSSPGTDRSSALIPVELDEDKEDIEAYEFRNGETPPSP